MRVTFRRIGYVGLLVSAMTSSCMDWEQVPEQPPLATTSAPTSSHYQRHVTPKSRWRIYSNLQSWARARTVLCNGSIRRSGRGLAR